MVSQTFQIVSFTLKAFYFTFRTSIHPGGLNSEHGSTGHTQPQTSLQLRRQGTEKRSGGTTIIHCANNTLIVKEWMIVLMNHCRGDLKMSRLLQFSHRGPTDGMAPQSFTLLSIMLCAVHVHSLCRLQGALVEKVNGLAENMVKYKTFKRYRIDTSCDAGKSEY